MVNQTEMGEQRYAHVAALSNGGFLVVWESDGQDAGDDIMGRFYMINGQPATDEIRINTYLGSNQLDPFAEGGSDGHGWVVWKGPYSQAESGYAMRRMAFNGTGIGEELHFASEQQGDPCMTLSDSGDMLLAWSEAGVVHGHTVGPDGVAEGTAFELVGNAGGNAINPQLAALPDGYAVAFERDLGPAGLDVQVLRTDQAGDPVSPPEAVHVYTEASQRQCAIEATGDGGYIVVWQGLNQGGDGGRIFGQRFDKDGNKLYH